ncbi:MAG: hypothetical protein PHE17_21090 [Thiothrix sp.]|jgi:Tfp pilus assembly protein PilX|uniref:pilus assembly PilX family protein n=1 Tax=Thiothrix sp. TaxID=1032 RepID=UPI002612FA3C|nr:hypothetical protein [Thiothrix sp.]MDD5395527.1 hypothetical protein [Thiothrix sp.]
MGKYMKHLALAPRQVMNRGLLYGRHSAQHGVVLFLALIALVAMTLAGIALVRSVDTSNLISGNFAFKQGSLQYTDVGVELAFGALPGIVSTSRDANIVNQYFALRQPTDSNGIPTTITWSAVPCRDTTGAIIACAGDYQVKYVIDRLCDGTLPVTNIQGKCLSDAPQGGGSKKAYAIVFSGSASVYYRVTVQVIGPRNTVSYAQTILAL